MDLNQKIMKIIFLLTFILNINCIDMSLEPKWHYLGYNKSIEFMNQLQQKYENLVKIYSIGKSTENRDLMVIKLTNNTNERPVLRTNV